MIVPVLSSIPTNSRTPSTPVAIPARTSTGPAASLRASAIFMPIRRLASSPGGTTCAPKNSDVRTWYGTNSTKQLRSRRSSLTFQPVLSLAHAISGWPSESREICGCPQLRVRSSRAPWPWTTAKMLATVPESMRTSSVTSATPESSTS